MKFVAVLLALALLARWPSLAAFLGHLAAVLPVLAAHGAVWALSQRWLLALALVAVCFRLAARRGWVR